MLQQGDCLGPYQLETLLGEGGMGQVFRAVQPSLGRAVALKVLRPGAVEPGGTDPRFRREISLAAHCDHPHVVKVLDGGECGGVLYLVMELLSGDSLASRLKKSGALPWQEALSLTACVADGLCYLHQRGILHRDVKPSNILFSAAGEPKLADFGLARGPDTTLITAEGAVVGTPLYMAPELLLGNAPSPASDLWSLGCVLYEMLTGHTVASMATRRGLARLYPQVIPAPHSRNASVPPVVSELTLALLEQDASRRLASAGELSARIQRLLAGTTRHATGAPARPGRGRHRTAALVLVGSSILFLAALRTGSFRDPELAPSRAAAASRPPPATRFDWFRAHLQDEAELERRAHSRQTVARLRRCAPFDLGESAELWTRWFKIVRWLSDGKGDPPPVARTKAQHPRGSTGGIGAVVAAADEFEDALFKSFLKTLRWDDIDRVYVSAVRCIVEFPHAAGSWLLLGAALEDDGRPEAAKQCYHWANLRLGRGDMDVAIFHVWKGLVGALWMKGPSVLEAEWPKWLPPSARRDAGWTALRAVLHQRNRLELFESLIRRTRRENPFGEVEACQLAAHLLSYRCDPSAAEAVLAAALQRHPHDPDLLRFALRLYANWGRSERVRHCLAGMPADSSAILTSDLQAMYVYLADSTEHVPPPPLKLRRYSGDEPEALHVEIFRHLEVSNIEEGAMALQRLPEHSNATAREQLQIELFGIGCTAPRLMAAVESILVGRPTASLPRWLQVAGALSAEQARTRMERLLKQAELRWGWGPVAQYRAVWLSRSGKLSASVEVVKRVLASGNAVQVDGMVLAEVVSRYIYHRKLNRQPSELAGFDISRFPRCTHSYAGYLSQLLREDLQAAADSAARFFEISPHERFWALGSICNALVNGDRRRAQEWARRLRMSIRFSCTDLWALREAKALLEK